MHAEHERVSAGLTQASALAILLPHFFPDLPGVYFAPAGGRMVRRALVVLAAGAVFALVCPGVPAQTMAESAILHGNSGISANVSRALGGRVQQSLANTEGKFSYPPRTARSARHGRTPRSKTRAGLPSRSSIAISSVVGGSAPCAAPAQSTSSQAKPGAVGGNGNCAAKTPAPVANAKSNPNEITVSF